MVNQYPSYSGEGELMYYMSDSGTSNRATEFNTTYVSLGDKSGNFEHARFVAEMHSSMNPKHFVVLEEDLLNHNRIKKAENKKVMRSS